MKSSLQ